MPSSRRERDALWPLCPSLPRSPPSSLSPRRSLPRKFPSLCMLDHSTSMPSAMEQSSCWMWTRRKLGDRPHLPGLARAAAMAASYDDSWEEQAFAEDAAGGLGGCIWPPRSYSCSFCRREFRSAQALGGHMNVHRRDRARLKLSPVLHIENSHHPHQHQHPNSFPPLAPRCSSQVGPSANPGVVATGSLLSPSRVSVASSQKNINDHTFVSSSFSSPMFEENCKRPLFTPLSLSLADRFSLGVLTIPELKLRNGDPKVTETECGEKRVVGKEEEAPSGKRRRLDVTMPFLGSYTGDGDTSLQSEVLGLNPSPIGDIDLELRLGNPTKVK